MLCLLWCGHAAAQTQQGTCGDNLTWVLANNTLVITGTGEMTSHPWEALKDSIHTVAIGEGVTNIMESAFVECDNLTSVTIPGSVERIGGEAFSWSGLTSVIIPEGVESIGERAFSFCNLTSVIISEGVESIGREAFCSCRDLESIVIPTSIRSIGGDAFWDTPWYENEDNWTGQSLYLNNALIEVKTGFSGHYEVRPGATVIADEAFAGCSLLMGVTLPESMTNIGIVAFSDCVSLKELTYNAIDCEITTDWRWLIGWSNVTTLTIGEKVKRIPQVALDEWSGVETLNYQATDCRELPLVSWRDLKQVTIGNAVTSIPDGMFSGCQSLTGLQLPAGLKRIGNNAFEETGLVTMDIPAGVDSIGAYAFSNCRNLQYAALPAGAISIGSYAFNGCSALTGITVPEGIKTLADGTFSSCSSLTTLNIPAGVDSIGAYAFSGCRNLQYVALPTGLAGIGSRAFDGCSALTNITLPEGVKTIADGTFYGCTNLTTLAIPTGVDSIGREAFKGCTGLVSLTLPEGIKTLADGTFYGCSSLATLTIPAGVGSIGWQAFYNCTGLTSLTLPEGLKSLGDEVLRGCSAVTTITIPENVTSIGNRAFYDCNGLTALELPASVTNVGQEIVGWCTNLRSFLWHATEVQNAGNVVGLFDGLTKLEEIMAPVQVLIGDTDLQSLRSLTITCGEVNTEGFAFIARQHHTLELVDLSGASNREMPDEALSECYKLKQLALPSSLERLGYRALAECAGITSVDLPASLTEIGDRAFENCYLLSDLVWGGEGSQLRRIGNRAFYGCNSLPGVSIPEGVEEIGVAAFMGCTYMENVELPSSLTLLGDNAFANGTRVRSMKVHATTPPALAPHTFYNIDRSVPVYVPAASLATYRATPYWQELNLQPMSGTTAVGSVLTDRLLVRGNEVLLPANCGEVQVYDMAGRCVLRTTEQQFILPQGVYMIQAGGNAVKAVVR